MFGNVEAGKGRQSPVLLLVRSLVSDALAHAGIEFFGRMQSSGSQVSILGAWSDLMVLLDLPLASSKPPWGMGLRGASTPRAHGLK